MGARTAIKRYDQARKRIIKNRMSCIFSESFVEIESNGDAGMRLFVSVMSPIQSATGEFQSTVTIRFERNENLVEEGTVTFSGATALRAVGRALLAVDTLLDTRLCSAGSLRMVSSGEIFDVEKHSAVPDRKYRQELEQREAARKIVLAQRTHTAQLRQLIQQVLPPEND